MTLKTAMLASSALAVLALATPAEARSQFYFSAGGGANWLQDDSFHAVTSPTVSADTLNFNPNSDVGFVINAAVGMHLDQLFNGFRVEVEGSYRQNSADGFWTSNVGNPAIVSSGGLNFDESVWAVLANAWWDINLGSSLTPYIGGGVGWGESKLDGTYVTGVVPSFKFTDSGFAWQLGAGVNWQVGPNVAIGVGYRYFVAPSVDVVSSGWSLGNDARGTVDVKNQAVMLDFTFALQ